MADGKDHVRVELTFHKNLPTLPVYKRKAESRSSLHPLLASGLASPQLLDHHHHRRPDRRLQHADSRQRRRRDNTASITDTMYRSTHQLLSQYQDHRRQHRSRHHPSFGNQLHRLLFQNRHHRRSREQSHRRRTLRPRSTFMSTLRKSSLYMKSTRSRMSPLHSSRLLQKLQDYQATSKRQHRSISLFCLPQRQQALGSHQGTYFKVLRRSLVRIHQAAL